MSVSALTATANPYVEGVIKSKLALCSNVVKILGPLNRPNITYVTLDIVGSPSNFNNFNFLIPADFNMQMTLEPTLVFFDTQNMARDVSRYINIHLGPEHQGRGIARHYHSGMSAEYLQQTYDSFASDLGPCKILCATKGASTVRVFHAVFNLLTDSLHC